MSDPNDITGRGFGEASERPASGLGEGAGPAAREMPGPGPGEASTSGDQPVTGTSDTVADADLGPLFEEAEVQDAKQRWRDIQAGFVDDPQAALKHADELNNEIIHALTSALETRMRAMQQGVANADTERLRIGLRQYGQLLERVLRL